MYLQQSTPKGQQQYEAIQQWLQNKTLGGGKSGSMDAHSSWENFCKVD